VSVAADTRWRLDFAGGALAVPSEVRPRLSKEDQVAGDFKGATVLPTDFKHGGSYAVGLGYALSDCLEVHGDFQQSLPGYDVENLVIPNPRLRTTFSVPVTKSALDIFSFSVGGRFYLRSSTSTVRPWLGCQIGWYRGTIHLRGPLCGGPESSTPCLTQNLMDQVNDGVGINAGGGVDVAVTRWLSLGLDLRYQNALTVFGGFDYVTTLFDVAVHF